MTTRLLFAASLLALSSLGCSGSSKPYSTVPVSGKVTLDGKPLPGARVHFQLMHTPQDGLLSGPESYGETDANGAYYLTTVFKEPGATVGRHRVMISTRKQERPPNDPDGKVKEVAPERVPNKYFTEKEPLYFEVTKEGSKEANFDLKSK